MSGAGAASKGTRSTIGITLREALPTATETALAIAAALLTTLSFPDFDFWFLAWCGLAPLFLAVAAARSRLRAFLLGWLYGAIFFYATCWWLTYPMIRYGHIRAWVAYPLFFLPIIFVALFPALACALISGVIRRFGLWALCVAPLIWISVDWLRYAVTGQLWNTLGYSQAFHPALIQSARWGGVYAITFLLVLANSAITLLLIKRAFFLSIAAVVVIVIVMAASAGILTGKREFGPRLGAPPDKLLVSAIQPNVPMDTNGDPRQMSELLERHLALSSAAIAKFENRSATPARILIWPESPMNFAYSRDPKLREVIGNFARANQTSVLLNSLEPAAGGGDQNSAVLINPEGVIAARYDKIRLMPFGEYVPLPRWLPGASSVRGLVGEFEPGSSYTLMPLGAFRAGVFICIEAAHPAIARAFTQTGAGVLINISNDGYLGPTAVMRQHLANAIFRAVENNRDLVRVTNTGISAYISSYGSVQDQTSGFQPEVRNWTISKGDERTTFYSRHGDLFVYGCALISLGIVSASFMSRKPERKREQA